MQTHFIWMSVLVALLIAAFLYQQRARDPQPAERIQFFERADDDGVMDGLRSLFYSGPDDEKLMTMVSEDLSVRPDNVRDPDAWLAIADGTDAASAVLKNDPMFWMLVSRLHLDLEEFEQARIAAAQMRSITDDPGVTYWSWHTQRQAGDAPLELAPMPILGVAFEHWIPGEPELWAMVCIMGNAPRLYISSGAGILGEVAYPGLDLKVEQFLAEAHAAFEQTETVKSQPELPPKGRMAFSMLTSRGVHVVTESDERIMNGQGPLAGLGLAAAELEATLLEAMKTNLAGSDLRP